MQSPTCTLASAAQAGVSVQAWFRASDLLEATRRWRSLTSHGLPVGLWEVEWTSMLSDCPSVIVGPLSSRVPRAGKISSRFWVVASESPTGCKVIKQRLSPEE